ncbi:MAG: hypothetical protein KBC30_11295, partial [Planctomycetes bacterium]|nr:hypothetical protein [Planctomycetota bacterium]
MLGGGEFALGRKSCSGEARLLGGGNLALGEEIARGRRICSGEAILLGGEEFALGKQMLLWGGKVALGRE